MPTLHDCLRLIASTRAVAEDPESAYASRARLKRSLLSAGQLAAARAGVPGPMMPEDIVSMHVQDPVSSEILHICVALLSKARSLCQPSEALDSRWRSGWTAVCDDLELLERSLRTNQDRLRNLPVS